MIRRKGVSLLLLVVLLGGGMVLQGCGAIGGIISGIVSILGNSNIMGAVGNALGAAGNIAGAFGNNDLQQDLNQAGQAVQQVPGVVQQGQEVYQGVQTAGSQIMTEIDQISSSGEGKKTEEAKMKATEEGESKAQGSTFFQNMKDKANAVEDWYKTKVDPKVQRGKEIKENIEDTAQKAKTFGENAQQLGDQFSGLFD